MLTRREYLKLTATTCASFAAAACASRSGLMSGPSSAQPGELISRPIPATGEQVPIIGLGSSASFQDLADNGNTAVIQEIFQTMFEAGGTAFDTAPAYGASERVAGNVINDMGMRERVFWATKLNVAGFGGGSADADEAWAQVETSLSRFGGGPIDLIQVHNIADMNTQFPILQEVKEQGRVRYIGVTSTFEPQYEALEQILRNEPLDFFGIDYAVDNRDIEQTLLPIAQDRGIAVMVYMPFGRTRLWDRVAGREVPAWAGEFGAETWAQFFLKFAASHPAVTVITPSTSDPAHMLDNMGAARGRLPDDEERRRMIELVEALPAA